MKEISSKNNQYIKDLSKLTNKKEIKEQGLFLVEGRNLVLEAIQLGMVENLLLSDAELFSVYDVEKTLVTDEIINKLSTNKSNRGAIAVCRYEPISVNLNLVKRIVVLENINNPGNLGAIIRSALAFNFDAVITLGDSVFVYNDKVIKAAQGALFKMPVMQLKDFKDLKDFKPYKLMLSETAKELDEVEIDSDKFAVVFGNEANGITDELKQQWQGEDVIIKINPSVESLNLAIAAGITLNKFK